MTDLTMSQFASKDDLLAAQAARIAELEAARIAYASEFDPDENGDPDVGSIHANIRKLKAQLESIGAGGVEPLRKQAAAPQEEAIAEIVSASHDQAEFGERAINFLRDFQHLEYGTKLYPAPQAVQAAVPTIAELEASAELGALRDVYEMARGVLRFDGIDMERALKYKDGLIEAIETVKTIDGGTWEPAHPAEGVPEQAAKLPPLPEPTAFLVCKGSEVTARAWNVDQMRAYAAAAIAATQPAAQGMEKDAARYLFLRDGDWRENDAVAPFIHLQLNALWDEKIDAAIAAQAKQGEQP